jgi:hypothetical protein
MPANGRGPARECSREFAPRNSADVAAPPIGLEAASDLHAGGVPVSHRPFVPLPAMSRRARRVAGKFVAEGVTETIPSTCKRTFSGSNLLTGSLFRTVIDVSCHPRARLTRLLGLLSPGQLRTGSLAYRVGRARCRLSDECRVDQRGPFAVVGNPDYELAGARPRVGRELVARKPQVVNVDALQGVPLARRMPTRSAIGAAEMPGVKKRSVETHSTPFEADSD